MNSTMKEAMMFHRSAPRGSVQHRRQPGGSDHLGWRRYGEFLRLVSGFMVLAWGVATATDLPGERSLVQIRQGIGAGASSTQRPDGGVNARGLGIYGQLPLRFEANRGQTDPQIHFLSRSPGHRLFLTSTEAVLVMTAPASTTHDHPGTREHTPGTVLRMTFLGATPQPGVVGREEMPGKAHYFIGNDPTKWHTDVPTYASVHYRELYPGIDLIYYGNQGHLEYDFVVGPGADPDRIVLGFQGIDRLEVDALGELMLHTAGGTIRQRKPVIYQEVDGDRRDIAGGYVLKNAHAVGFQVAAYDVTKPLVIDPVLVFSSYLGGSGDDYGVDIAVDTAGHVYVTGTTQSLDFPTTADAFQPTFGGSADAFVTKLNPCGTRLVYSTYLGGESGDAVHNIVIDGQPTPNAYVTGATRSTAFPTTSESFQTVLQGGVWDAFVAKIAGAAGCE